jgi:allantoinase
MEKLKDSSTVLMFHAEMILLSPPRSVTPSRPVLNFESPAAPTGPAYQTFLESHTQSFETYAIEQILALAPYAPDLELHIIHLASTSPPVKESTSPRKPMTTEAGLEASSPSRTTSTTSP